MRYLGGFVRFCLWVISDCSGWGGGYFEPSDAGLEQRVLELQFFFAHGERVGIGVALQIFVEGFKGGMEVSGRHRHSSFSQLQPVGLGREKLHFLFWKLR